MVEHIQIENSISKLVEHIQLIFAKRPREQKENKTYSKKNQNPEI